MQELELKYPVSDLPSAQRLKADAAAKMALGKNAAFDCRVVRRSIDARGGVSYCYKLRICFPGEDPGVYELPEYKDVTNSEPVLVIGAGPAGMFAALRLLMEGLKPIILERGKDVHRRKVDMAVLSRTGALNPDSNYCYGEGGAGTFSDGKLFTRSSKRGDIREVLYQLVKFGASEDILIDAHPHIGSDKLPLVVENIRKCIIAHGGEYHFDSRVTNIEEGFKVTVADGTEYRAKNVVLATGHSARDIYEMLSAKGCRMEAKGFALGVRAEHPQEIINKARYHNTRWPGMSAAEYSFVEQIDGRGVFSFCMCPGGILVPSSTEERTVVLNGMSNSARNSRWANAGVVVQIEPEDVPEKYIADGAFSLLNFQRDVERNMFMNMGANPMAAPAQRMTDFCRRRISADLPQTSYFPGAIPSPLHMLLPEGVSRRLAKVFPIVDRKLHGYYSDDALLLGVESRTSSPVRICRDPETLQSENIKGLYPCGEGAGYSGGIVSSAIDGIRVAAAIAAGVSK